MAQNLTLKGLGARLLQAIAPAPTATTGDYIPPGALAKVASRVGDGLQNLVANLGNYGDKRSYNDYVAPIVQDPVRLRNMWRGSWLARNIVQIPADDMFRAWVDRSWDGADADAKTRENLEAQESDLQMPRKTWEAMIWGRLFGGAAIVPMIKGDFRNWNQPLELEQIQRDSLLSFQVFDRWRLTSGSDIDRDPRSPNCGLPLFYTLAESAVQIHWTRVIRFGGDILPYWDRISNSYWDDSVLQSPIDAIKDFDASSAGAASMIWEANVDIVSVEGLRDMLGTDAGTTNVTNRFVQAFLMKAFNRTLLLDKTYESWTQKTNQFSGVKDIVDKLMLNVAGAARIPVTKLFRQSPAGMDATGESDIALYDDDIDGIRKRELIPAVRRMDEIRLMSLLGKIPEDFKVTGRALRPVTQKEQAEIDNMRAEMMSKLIGDHVITPGLAARELDHLGTFVTMEDEDVELAEEYEATVPPMLPGGAAPGSDPEDPEPSPGDPPTEDDSGDEDTKDAKAADARVYVGDAQQGDYVCREEDGWHSYVGGTADSKGRHIGGPYKTDRGAITRLRRFSRDYRKSATKARRSRARDRRR